MKPQQNKICETTMDALMPLFQEQWETGASVRFSPNGVSMLPMLRQGADSVVLSPLPPGMLKKYDLPLYRRSDGKYILHRIVDLRDGHYVCCGDNQTELELPVYHDQMLALVTAFYRGNRCIPVTAPGYQIYCRVWCSSLPLRRLYKRGHGYLGRLKRKVFP